MAGARGHITVRRKPKDGVNGNPGLQGCILRQSEWVAGVKYRNDESLTSGTRYLDIVIVTTSATSFKAYKCKTTHTSSSSIPVTNTTYWDEFNSVAPIYTPLIMAQNALLRFTQTNQLLVMKSDNSTVAAGMGGGDYPLWAGAVTPANAPFRVSIDGKLYSTDAEISGVIVAKSGSFGAFSIGEGSYSEGLIKASLPEDSFGDTYEISIQANRFFMRGTDIANRTEFVLIMPNVNWDCYDTEGLVWISSKEDSVALAIDGGMILGIRPYIQEATYATNTIRGDTIIVKNQTSTVTLNLNDYLLSKGALFRVINLTQQSIKIMGTNNVTLIDLINGAEDVSYCTIAPQDGAFKIVYDGVNAIVYK